MILLDTALEKLEAEGKPIRVGIVGIGFMGRAIGWQIAKYTRGMRLAGASSRNLDAVRQMYAGAAIANYQVVTSQDDLDAALAGGVTVATDNAFLLCRSPHIDVILEVTGAVEFGSRVALEAMKHSKHVVWMNAELMGTLGPILKTYADKAGVILTECNGDQPGVTMDLYRHVKSIGLRPVLCGNLKGLQDEYRTPATQVEFARKWGQKPEMVSGFADGSKMSFEQASIANATDMRVAKRGMYGFRIPPNTNLDDAVKVYPTEALLNGPGFVDYLVGVAFPAPAVFVLATTDDPLQKTRLNLYKQGEGPLYCFFTPYHLCHLETPMSVARAVIFNDATLTPLSGPKVEVVSIAKRDLAAGERLDGVGKFMLFGVCENATTARKECLLPIGLAEDCVLKRAVPKDQAVTFDDVELPPGRLCDELWREQCDRFAEELR